MRRLTYFLVPVLLLLGACTYGGFMRESKQPMKHDGLDTVPYYREGSASFSTGAAIQAALDKKKAEEKLTLEREAELKSKFNATPLVDDPLNPYVSPRMLNTNDLPEAIRYLPKDPFGYIDWGAALTQNAINPKWSLDQKNTGDDPETLDMDIVFEINDRLMSNVLFSHKKHTAWLTCTNCHPSVFIPQKGANIFFMQDIWNGLYCGKCHGRVAFQPKGFENCQRCHSVKKKSFGIQ